MFERFPKQFQCYFSRFIIAAIYCSILEPIDADLGRAYLVRQAGRPPHASNPRTLDLVSALPGCANARCDVAGASVRVHLILFSLSAICH